MAEGCGGCGWQHRPYEEQLARKAEHVRRSLARGAGLEDVPVRSTWPAPSPWAYRNRMDFTFHHEGGLGLHAKEAWDRIVAVDECFIAPPAARAALEVARGFVREHGTALHDPRTHRGLLRLLVVRASRATGEVLLAVVTSDAPFDAAPELAARLMAGVPGAAGVLRAVQGDRGRGFVRVERLAGADAIEERLGGFAYRVGLETFFQTSSAGAERLLEVALEAAGDVAGRLAFDLCCGVGTFTLPLARAGARAVGIEVVPASIEAARANAARNGVAGVEWIAGDARRALPEAALTHGRPDLVLLDPPRAGVGGRVMRRLGRLAPERVVYVSCNPTSLAEDLRELLPFGYVALWAQPLDLFPQTRHVETVVALVREPVVSVASGRGWPRL